VQNPVLVVARLVTPRYLRRIKVEMGGKNSAVLSSRSYQQTMSADTNFNFSGKNILVVGASRAGIGAAIARAFQDAGASVVITGVEAEPAPEDKARFPYVQLDVRNNEAIKALAAATPRLDVLINGAAITARGEEMAPDFFVKVVDINLHGTFRLAEAFHAHLKATSGCIINIASMYAQFGSPRNPAYGASKAAVQQLTKSLAIAWAPDGIRVNAVAPGFIVTEQSARSRTDPQHVENVNKRTPLGRWGQPEDIAGPVLFLASDQAKFMTGTCIAIDGGYSVT
jgi:NAD(P)-dependent dehydrogenase (short-subunit alcohol dehydrogenase family)